MCIDMQNGSFSRYYNTYSIIHLLNPLSKVLVSLIFIFMILLSSNFVVCIALLLILLILINISNIPIKSFLQPLFNMKFLFLFVIIIDLIFNISLYNSLMSIFKICLFVIYSSLLIYTTSTNELAIGIYMFLYPLTIFKIPVFKISMTISLSINFISLLFLQSNKILKSQKSRGFNYSSGSIKQKIIGIRSVFIPVFINSMKRAEEIGNMIEIRNFNFNNSRTFTKSMKLHYEDIYIISFHLIIFIFVLVKEVVI